MFSCINCGAETKYENGLCFDCYQEKEKNEKNGLSDKEYTYRYGMIKGRIAETLIQELFLSLGYNVFRYGMENTIPGIMGLLKGVKSNVATEIRRMPDFVIQNKDNFEVYFVEVKFRAAEQFSLRDIEQKKGVEYPYQNAYFIVVSKKHIKCITYEQLKNGEEITPTSKNYLGNVKEFSLDKNVIIEFCDFAVKFFESVK